MVITGSVPVQKLVSNPWSFIQPLIRGESEALRELTRLVPAASIPDRVTILTVITTREFAGTLGVLVVIFVPPTVYVTIVIAFTSFPIGIPPILEVNRMLSKKLCKVALFGTVIRGAA